MVLAKAFVPCGLCAASIITVGSLVKISNLPGEVNKEKAPWTNSSLNLLPTNASTAAKAIAAFDA